jgi:hypothetical protein
MTQVFPHPHRLDVPDFVESFHAVTATKANFGVRISKQSPPGRTIT